MLKDFLEGIGMIRFRWLRNNSGCKIWLALWMYFPWTHGLCVEIIAVVALPDPYGFRVIGTLSSPSLFLPLPPSPSLFFFPPSFIPFFPSYLPPPIPSELVAHGVFLGVLQLTEIQSLLPPSKSWIIRCAHHVQNEFLLRSCHGLILLSTLACTHYVWHNTSTHKNKKQKGKSRG